MAPQDCQVAFAALETTFYVSLTLALQIHWTGVSSAGARKPYGPRMCEVLCSTYTDCTDLVFSKEGLACYVINRYGSKSNFSKLTQLHSLKNVSVTTCGRESRAITTRLQGFKCIENPVWMRSSRHLTDVRQPPKISPVMPLTKPTQVTSLVPDHSRNIILYSSSPRPALASMDSKEKRDKERTNACEQTESCACVISKEDENILPDFTNNITLHQACEEGKLTTVKYILTIKADDINSQDEKGRTPLMTAARKGQKTIFDFLVFKGCRLMGMDYNYNNILHLACRGGCIDIVRALIIDHNFDMNSKGSRGLTPLMSAVTCGHMGVVKLLVSKGCNQTDVDKVNNNALHVACVVGQIKIVRYFLFNCNIKIDSRGRFGGTAVMQAAGCGHTDLVKFLVDEGCSLTDRDMHNDSILHVASLSGNVNTVLYILAKGVVDTDSRGRHGSTPVMLAAELGYTQVVELLARKGCSLTVHNNYNDNVLHLACCNGHLETVRYLLLQARVDIDSRGNQGRTPVMMAAANGHNQIVEFLVTKGCSLTLVDDNTDNILHEVCQTNFTHMVEYILSQGKVSIDSRGKYQQTPVMLAVFHGRRLVVECLVKRGCDMMVVDSVKNTVLHEACRGGHIDVVAYILSQSTVSINSRGEHGWTPVMVAAYKGQIEVVTLLVSKGCSLREVDARNNTILHVACTSGHVGIVKYILSRGILGIDCRGLDGQTPVMIAAQCGKREVLKFLVNEGCSLTKVDNHNSNLLHMACGRGEVDIVKFILGKGSVNKESRDKNGMTPMLVAARQGQWSVVALLVDEGCNVYASAHGSSILHYACISGDIDMVKYLISVKKMDRNKKNNNGRTPLQTAYFNNNWTVVRFLQSMG